METTQAPELPRHEELPVFAGCNPSSTCSPCLKRSRSLLEPAAEMPTHRASGACSKRSGLLQAGSNYIPSRGEGAWACGIPTVITIIWHYFFWGPWSWLPWTPLDGTTRHTSVQVLAMAAAAPALGQVGRRAPSSSQVPSHAHNRPGGLTRKTGWNNLPSPSKATRNSAVESCLATEVTGSISSSGWMCQGEAPKSRSVFSYDSEMGECQSLNTSPKRDGKASIWAENRNQLVVLLNYLSIGKLCDLKNLHIPSVSFTISMHPNIFNMLFVNCHLPVFLHPPE